MAAKTINFGTKSIYLPTFRVALVRTPKLSPYQAKFLVPLNFSKFDLRDYLYHAYNVRALQIRSTVVQQPVRDSLDARRQFFRPESKKFMTIEMERPFVWPENPDSWSPWGTEETKKHQVNSVMDLAGGMERVRDEIKTVKDVAREYLAGARKSAEGGDKDEAKKGGRKRVGLGLKEWEKRRTLKYVEADEPQYKIRV